MISALVAALLAAASPADTVFTVDGGRITGTVLEESATSGVTIQTPDGSVRRIDRAQVSRIEFADGTVSPARPPAAPAPQAAPAARPPAAEGPSDTVFFRGGGRVRGTVMEESATAGTKVRLLDASIRTYPPDEIARIEYSDGTVSTPQGATAKAPDAAPRAKPPEGAADNVYFLGGGRVRGTVIEENPKTGVKVRLLDGTMQVYPRDDLVRIEYADWSVSRRVTPPPPAAAAAAPPQPAAAPTPAPPAHPAEKRQLIPLYLTLGVGATFLGGDAERDVRMSSVLDTTQAHLSSELGLRLSPAWVLGVYGDVGGGEPASSIRDACNAQGNDCVGTTGRVGLMVRHTWSPLSTRPMWLSLGTGWEFGGVTIDQRGTGSGSNRTDLVSYTGRKYVRVGAGIDFRSNQVIGFGLYGSLGFGEYDRYEDPTTDVAISRGTHTTAQFGVRLILFP
jgi:hypothetical protein